MIDSNDKHNESIDELSRDYDAYLKHMNTIIDKADINQEHTKSLIIAGLFSKILGAANAITILINNRCYTETEILARSCLEALFYMGACINNEDALKRYLGRDKYNKRTHINCVLESKSISLSESDRNDFQKRKTELDSEISSNNLRKLYVLDAAEMAGVIALYNTRYRIHSEAVHSNPGYLLETYFELGEKGVEQINILPYSKRTLERLLDTMNVVLALSCDWYRNLFNINRPEEIRNIDYKYIQAK